MPSHSKQLADQLPRATMDAEMASLGAAMISSTAALRLLELLTRDDFYLGAHRHVYDAIARLVSRGVPADTLTVAEELRQRDLLAGIGDVAYIHVLVESVPTAAHIDHYAAPVLRAANLRRLQAAGRDIAAVAAEALDDEPAFEQGRRLLEEAGQRRRPHTGPQVLTGKALLERDFPPRPQVIPGLVPLGVTILAGQPKAKKSFLALQLVLALAHGGLALGHIPVTPAGTLAVFLEDPFPEVKARIRQFQQDGGLPETALFAEAWRRLDEGGELWLERILAQHPEIRLVILDPFIRVRGGRARQDNGNAYEHDYADLEPLSRLATAYETAILIIHHTGKVKQDDPFDCISGSRGMQGMPDSLMVLEALDDQLSRATLHVRGRGGILPQQRALSWQDHSGWTDLGSANQVAANREQEEVQDLLRAGPLRWRVLVDRLMDVAGIDEGAAKMRVSRMSSRSQIHKDGSLYYLAGEVRQQPVTPVIPDTPVTAVTRLPGRSVTGETPVTAVTEGTEVTGTSRENDDPSSVPTDPSRTRRWEVRRLAAARLFPALRLSPARAILRGEAAWAAFCRTAAPAELDQAAAALAPPAAHPDA